MRFGSVTNMFITNGVIGMPEPTVGMGCTICHWTDRDAGTVVEVKKNRDGKVTRVKVQKDKAHRQDKNGMSECQDYIFEIDPKGEILEFTLRKNGRWAQKSGPMNGGVGISFGKRSAYYDYSF